MLRFLLFLLTTANAAPKAEQFSFTKKVFITEYSSDGVINSEEIKIQSDNFSDVKISLNNDLFKASDPDDDGVVKLSLPGTSLPDNILDDLVVVLKITATKVDQKATSNIFVKLPKARPEYLQFSKKVYWAAYNLEANKITLEDVIKFDGNSDGAEVILGGDSINDFVAKLESNGEITLTYVGDKISETIFLENLFIVTLTATGNDLVETADVVVKLPNIQPVTLLFSDSVYFKEYTDGKLASSSDIVLKADDLSKVTVTASPEDVFKADLDSKTGIITLSLIVNTIPDLDTEDIEVIVKVVAAVGLVTEAVDVIVKLQGDQVVTPLHFSDYLYTGEYSDGCLSVDFIRVRVEDDDLSKAEVSLDASESGKSLAATLDKASGEVTLTLKEPLSSTANQITVKLTATTDKETTISSLIVKLPNTQKSNPAALHFTNNLYVVNYIGGNIPYTDIVVRGGDLTDVTVSLNEEASRYFTTTLSETTGIVQLLVNDEKLPDEVLKNDFIIVQVTVKDATSDVVIKLREKNGSYLHFKSNFYTAIYTDEGSCGKVITNDEIFIVNDDLSKVSVRIDEENSEHFLPLLTRTTGVFKLLVRNNKLDSEILLKNELIVKVTATDGEKNVTTDVVVKLPKVTQTPLHFSNNVYAGEYDDKSGLKLNENIKVIAQDLAEVTVTTDNNCKATVINGEVKLESCSLIGDGNEIVVKITAETESERVTSDVVVTLQKPSNLPLHFTSKVYVVEYAEGSIVADTDIEVVDKNFDKVRLEFDKAVFNGTVDGAGKVILAGGGSEDYFKDKKDFVKVTVTALNDRYYDRATVYVVLSSSGCYHGLSTVLVLLLACIYVYC